MRNPCLWLRHLSAVFLALAAALASPCVFSADETSSAHGLTYLRESDIRCNDPSNAAACYRETVCRILNGGKSAENCDVIDHEQYIEGHKDNYSRYRVSTTPSDEVILSIHMIWSNADEFHSTLEAISKKHPNWKASRIELTLPGHRKFGEAGKDPEYLRKLAKHPAHATHEEWILALDESIAVARNLGKNVTVIGHSTGGLLAMIAALKYPDVVKRVLLVEPSLKVRSLMNFGSCSMGKIIDGIQKFRKIGGPFPDRGSSMHMGCEVNRLAKKMILNHSSEFDRESYTSAIQNLAYLIPQPVALLNNVKDITVSTNTNHAFFNALPRTDGIYVRFNEDGKMPHGLITQKDVPKIVDTFYELMRRPIVEPK